MIVYHIILSQLKAGYEQYKQTFGKVEDRGEISLIPNHDMLKLIKTNTMKTKSI